MTAASSEHLPVDIIDMLAVAATAPGTPLVAAQVMAEAGGQVLVLRGEVLAAHHRIDELNEVVMECPVCNHDLRIDTERHPVGLKVVTTPGVRLVDAEGRRTGPQHRGIPLAKCHTCGQPSWVDECAECWKARDVTRESPTA